MIVEATSNGGGVTKGKRYKVWLEKSENRIKIILDNGVLAVRNLRGFKVVE